MKYIVLQDSTIVVDGVTCVLHAADIIDEASTGFDCSIDDMRCAGVALMEYDSGTFDESIEAFQAARKNVNISTVMPFLLSFGVVGGPRLFTEVEGEQTIERRQGESFLIHVGASTTWHLPPLSEIFSGWYFMVHNDENLLTIDPYGSELIDGLDELVLTNNQIAFIVRNDTGWKSIIITTSN